MSSLCRQSRQVSCKHSPKDSLHTDWIRSQRGDTQPAHRHTTGWLPLVVLPPSLMRQTREDRHSETHVDITRNGFLSTSCKSLQYCKRASFHRIPFLHMWSLRPQSQIWLATYFFSGPINQIQYVYRDFLKGCGLSHFGRKVSGTIRTAIYDNFNKQFISTVYYFFIDQSIRWDFLFFCNRHHFILIQGIISHCQCRKRINIAALGPNSENQWAATFAIQARGQFDINFSQQ